MKPAKHLLLAALFSIAAAPVFAQTDSVAKASEDIFMTVETMPEFPGGQDGLNAFIVKTTKYPAEAKKDKIEGVCYVSFIVNKQGEVIEPKIAKGAHPLLDAEALRVIALMPKWKPGMQKGKAVLVQFYQPFNFKL